jgi:hypothetical protein
MVSIFSGETEGEVVYLFDAESQRGNATFPFKSVRIRNPTDSALESGPVAVFGEGRFIGEGLAEPIPPRSMAFVPFALDRQIMVEKKESENDKIARIITVQRGVFHTEMQHIRRQVVTLHNRTDQKAVVFVRRTVPQGYALALPLGQHERIGAAHLFRVEVDAHGKAELAIEETTPVFKTTDIRSPSGMELVSAYLSHAATDGPLKERVVVLEKLHREMANIEQQIATLREQMGDMRQRQDELHAQLVTLKAVRTAGPLMQSLEKKLQEVSDKMSKATIDVVSLQEKLMLARVRFQDGLADLSLEKKEEKISPAAPASKT